MKRIALFLTEQQISALKQLRKQTGLTLAELVRRAIDFFLKQDGGK